MTRQKIQRAANRVVEQILGQRPRRRVNEGTVIVLNDDSPSSPSAPKDGDQSAIIRAVLDQLQRTQATRVPASQPQQPTANDKFQVEHGGKLWKFKINRDPNGLITDMDVLEGM